jgi:phage-related protein
MKRQPAGWRFLWAIPAKFNGIRAYSSSKSCMNDQEYSFSIDVQERL